MSNSEISNLRILIRSSNAKINELESIKLFLTNVYDELLIIKIDETMNAWLDKSKNTQALKFNDFNGAINNSKAVTQAQMDSINDEIARLQRNVGSYNA